MTGPYRRRILLIKRALQMKYVMLVFVAAILAFGVVSLDVYYVVGKLAVQQLGDANLLPLLKSASRLLVVHFSVYLLVVGLCAVFFSHKVAGPIFRLEQIAAAVASGDLSVKASLRQGDELFETAEQINRMIDSLRDKILRDRNLCARISGQLEDLAAKLKAGKVSPQDASAAIGDILLEERHVASEFKL